MQNPVLFDTGEARLKSPAIPILRDIAKLLSELSDNFISVEGHTDNVPIHTEQFPSNLELSTARAISVARFLIDEGKIGAENVSVVGYSENVPVVPNDTPENRMKNRRVEINVLRVRPRAGAFEFLSQQGEETGNAA